MAGKARPTKVTRARQVANLEKIGKGTGLNKVLKNFNREINKIEQSTPRAMVKVVLLVKRRAQQQTPVDTNNLRASAETDVVDQGRGLIMGIVRYTAKYAHFVHEINKNYVVGNWKFLQNAVIQSKRDILNIFREEAKIR